MSRQGVSTDALAPFLARFAPGSPLKLEGVMTHLFAADESDGRVTQRNSPARHRPRQITAAGLYPSGSTSATPPPCLPAAQTIADLAARQGMKAMIRPGLALYGLDPEFDAGEPPAVAAARAHLQPVLSWKTRVAASATIPAGAVVGYNGTFVATEPMRLALLAAGYADGLDRRLGNHFSLLVRGQRAPLVGRISMDQAVLDVTDIPVSRPATKSSSSAAGAETITAFDHAQPRHHPLGSLHPHHLPRPSRRRLAIVGCFRKSDSCALLRVLPV